MGVLSDRAAAVRQLARDYDHLTTEFVQEQLGCGRHQAARAIRQARSDGAAAGELWSYANPANDNIVRLEGESIDRVLSWTTRERDGLTRTKNSAAVMSAALVRADATKYERAVAKMAVARVKDAEAEELRLDAIRELLP